MSTVIERRARDDAARAMPCRLCNETIGSEPYSGTGERGRVAHCRCSQPKSRMEERSCGRCKAPRRVFVSRHYSFSKNDGEGGWEESFSYFCGACAHESKALDYEARARRHREVAERIRRRQAKKEVSR